MDHKVIKIFIPLFLIAACFFSGCGENPEEEDQPAIQVKKSFIKIQDHGMELKIISTLEFYTQTLTERIKYILERHTRSQKILLPCDHPLEALRGCCLLLLFSH